MNHNIDFFALWSLILGGLALFLFGMDILTKALRIVAGSRMKDILASLTKNRFIAIVTGAISTAVANSSSITTVVLVGFVSAGLITATQSVGVIMGANIGSTFAAQILAFKITSASLPIIAFGFFINLLAKKERIREYGNMFLGFGLVFFGMSIMGDAFKPLKDYEPFMTFIASVDNRLLGILVGAVFTIIMQYSAVTIGVVIIMASQGLLTLPLAIALVFGANIGTCATAAFAVIGKTKEAKRTAVIHILFNVLGVAIWVWFINDFADLLAYFSTDISRQIANSHTLFNVMNTVIFIWFAPYFAKLAQKLIPTKQEEEQEHFKPLFISNDILDVPDVALSKCRMEIGELGKAVMEMYGKIMPAVITGEKEDLDNIVKMDEKVDALHSFIIEFLGKLVKKSDYDEYQTDEIMELIQVTNHFENMGDIIETGLVTVGKRRLAEKVVVSRETKDMLEKYHQQIMFALEKIVVAVRDRNMSLAKEVYEMKKGMSRLTLRAARHQALRLVASAPNRLQTYTREMEMIENFSQIFKLCRRIAKAMFNGRNLFEKIALENQEKSSKKFENDEPDFSV